QIFLHQLKTFHQISAESDRQWPKCNIEVYMSAFFSIKNNVLSPSLVVASLIFFVHIVSFDLTQLNWKSDAFSRIYTASGDADGEYDWFAIGQTQLKDIHISIKTAGKSHRNRLKFLLDTWIPLAKNQVWQICFKNTNFNLHYFLID